MKADFFSSVNWASVIGSETENETTCWKTEFLLSNNVIQCVCVRVCGQLMIECRLFKHVSLHMVWSVGICGWMGAWVCLCGCEWPSRQGPGGGVTRTVSGAPVAPVAHKTVSLTLFFCNASRRLSNVASGIFTQSVSQFTCSVVDTLRFEPKFANSEKQKTLKAGADFQQTCSRVPPPQTQQLSEADSCFPVPDESYLKLSASLHQPGFVI